MTPDVSLRPVIEADIPEFFEHQLDPDATRMAAFPSRDREKFDAHWKKIMADSSVVLRAILCDSQVAGNIVCFEQHGEWLVGYWIGKGFWGRGIATRALALFLEEAPRRPLFARVAKHNLGSIRVLEKCGFIVAGEDTTPGDDPVAEWIMKLEGG